MGNMGWETWESSFSPFANGKMTNFHLYDEQSVNGLRKNALAVCQFPLSVNSGGLLLLKIKEPVSTGKFGKNITYGLNRLL
jgi:hypothetical protein